MNFALHPKLAAKTFIVDLPLCQVLLENESHYPWVILVPRRSNVARIMDLESNDQLQLLKELDWAQKVLWNEFNPTQLNVAALGNKVPQLHIHVIARHSNDPAWPQTVWDHPIRSPYASEQKEEMVKLLVNGFERFLQGNASTLFNIPKNQ